MKAHEPFAARMRAARAPKSRLAQLLAWIPPEWPRSDFVVCGSAALAVRGVRDVNDLDVLVKVRLWTDVRRREREGYWPKREHAATAKDGTSNDGPRRELIITGWFDFFTKPPRIAGGITEADVFARAETHSMTGDVQIQSLRQVLAIKALADRPKDLDDMIRCAQLIADEEGGLEPAHASGDAQCSVCRRAYRLHPHVTDPRHLNHEGRPYLRRTCEGRMVKL